MPSTDMNTFRQVLSNSKHIIAVAGAGLSAASGELQSTQVQALQSPDNENYKGIPTFRGAGGLWRKYDAMNLATPGAFAKKPSQVWQFYHYRRET